LDCGTAHVACKFVELHAKIDRKTNKVIEENPTFVKKGDAVIVTLVPTKPMIVEVYKEFPSLGRFAVRDIKQTIAVGIVLAV